MHPSITPSQHITTTLITHLVIIHPLIPSFHNTLYLTPSPSFYLTLSPRTTYPQEAYDPSVISEEFRRLDITGEGRLTYINIKAALDLREVGGGR